MMDKIPPAYFELVYEYFALFRNDTEDFGQPHLRRSVQYVYPLFVFLYGVLIVVGTVGNLCLLGAIFRRRLHRDPTFYFVCNLALSDLIKCLFVLPITLANLLIQNWVFGSFLCFCIPMMQHIPIHASMLTFLLIAVDRYRLVLFPMTSRVPRFLCVLGIWVLSVCVVLPFAIYIKYFDFQQLFGPQFEGTGLCTVNVEDDMEEYIRGLFIALYVLPLAIIGFLHVRISGEIKCRENPMAVAAVLFEMSSCTDEGVSRSTMLSGSVTPCPTRSCGRSSSSWLDETDGVVGGDNNIRVTALDTDEDVQDADGLQEQRKPSTAATSFVGASSSFDAAAAAVQWRRSGCYGNGGNNLLVPATSTGAVDDLIDDYDCDGGFDPQKEKRTQKYLITTVTLFAMCLCPLEIMRLVKNIVTETNDNTGHFDLAYIVFVWIGFLPTCITPILFASSLMSRPAKERLRGYFRFSNRGGRRSTSASSVPRRRHRSSSSGGCPGNVLRAPSPGGANKHGTTSRDISTNAIGHHRNSNGTAVQTVTGGHSNEGYVPSSTGCGGHLHPSASYVVRGASKSTVATRDDEKRQHRRKSFA